MTTKTRTARLTDEEVAALEMLADLLGISGQRDAKYQPLQRKLAHTASAAMTETVWLLDIAFNVAAGGDLEELLEFTSLPEVSE